MAVVTYTVEYNRCAIEERMLTRWRLSLEICPGNVPEGRKRRDTLVD